MDGRSQDFVSHFFEQDSWVMLLVVGVPAAAFLVLLAIVVAVARPLRRGRGRRFLAVVAIALGVLVVTLTIFESLSQYFRSVPPGSGLGRQFSYDTYVTWAHASFVGLYVLIVGGAVVLGRRVLGTCGGRRSRRHRRRLHGADNSVRRLPDRVHSRRARHQLGRATLLTVGVAR